MTTELISHVNAILHSGLKSVKEKLFDICHYLQGEVDHYDWVGFYFAQKETRTLHLGPYAGEPTDHKVIPFGKGICGQVAISNESFLVDDVHAQDNYIACNINVKSEIVVPLFLNGQNIGQIDIDSNTKNAFTQEDNAFLKTVNEKISRLLNSASTDLENLWI